MYCPICEKLTQLILVNGISSFRKYGIKQNKNIIVEFCLVTYNKIIKLYKIH